MGQGSSKSSEVLQAERALPPEALKHLQSEFQSKASSDGLITPEKLQEMLGLQKADKRIRQAASAAVTTQHESGADPKTGVTWGKLILFIDRCTQASDGAAEAAFEILAGSRAAKFTAAHLHEALTAWLTWALGSEPSSQVVTAIIQGMLSCSASDKELDLGGFSKWSRQFPAVSQTLRRPFICLAQPPKGLTEQSAALPDFVFPKGASMSHCLLDPGAAWLLSSTLPENMQQTWQLTFNSNMHGLSFNTFMGRAGNNGPTITLIKDKQGHVFGGFCPDPWERHGTFYGSFTCFIFQLLPQLQRHRPKGMNENYQWCGHNFASASIPNGFGWGGQVGYFGLFVDGSFETGMSRPAATFGNPCLASAERFEIDAVECWRVQLPTEEELEEAARQSNSVLDRFKEDRSFMAMAGRAVQSSAGYREAPPEDKG